MNVLVFRYPLRSCEKSDRMLGVIISYGSIDILSFEIRDVITKSIIATSQLYSSPSVHLNVVHLVIVHSKCIMTITQRSYLHYLEIEVPRNCFLKNITLLGHTGDSVA